MSENVAWVVLPVVITGLGYLAYKHPKLTGGIVAILLVFTIVGYGVVETLAYAKINTYEKSISTMDKTSIYKGDDSQATITGFSWDSVLIADPMLKDFSAVYNRESEEGNKLAKASVVSHAIGLTKKKTREALEILVEKEEDKLSITQSYFLWTGITFGVLLVLCGIFDKLPHAKAKDDKKGENNDTPQEIF